MLTDARARDNSEEGNFENSGAFSGIFSISEATAAFKTLTPKDDLEGMSQTLEYQTDNTLKILLALNLVL